MTKEDVEQFRAVVRDEVKTEIHTAIEPLNRRLNGVEKHMKTMTRKLNRVQKDISLLVKNYDHHIIHLRERIEQLEDHTGIHKN